MDTQKAIIMTFRKWWRYKLWGAINEYNL